MELKLLLISTKLLLEGAVLAAVRLGQDLAEIHRRAGRSLPCSSDSTRPARGYLLSTRGQGMGMRRVPSRNNHRCVTAEARL